MKMDHRVSLIIQIAFAVFMVVGLAAGLGFGIFQTYDGKNLRAFAQQIKRERDEANRTAASLNAQLTTTQENLADAWANLERATRQLEAMHRLEKQLRYELMLERSDGD